MFLSLLFFLLINVGNTQAQTDCQTFDDGPYFIVEDNSIFLNDITINDFCPVGDPDPCQIIIVNQPVNGVLSLNCGVTYTPNNNYNGADNFTYKLEPNGNTATVSINIAESNDPPTANDDSFEIPKNFPYEVAVLGNDSDPDSPIGPCDVSIVTPPNIGTLYQYPEPTCELYFIPPFDLCGITTFTYQLCDSFGACDNATVTIDIICNTPPQAVNDILNTQENTPLSFDPTLNDSDVEDGSLDPCNASAFTQPSNGTVSTNSCSFSYTPNNNFCGNDSFQYQVCDSEGGCSTAYTIIAVTCSNMPPTAQIDYDTTNINTPILLDLISNDSDPEDGALDPCNASILTQPGNGMVTYQNCQFTYTPNAGFCGNDNFTYQICDSNNSCNSGFVNLQVRCALLDIKVLLAGPFKADSSLMSDQLRAVGNIPTTEPYTNLGYNRGNATGGETITNSLLQNTGIEAIVDWVLIEIRDNANHSTVITTIAALVRRDGQVVDVNGNFPLEIKNLDLTQHPEYIVSIRHRNHLSTFDSATVCSGASCSVDFSSKPLPGQTLLSDGFSYGLQTGSANGDDSVDATDRSATWNNRNTTGYKLEDVNMDNSVDASDRSITWNFRNQSITLP